MTISGRSIKAGLAILVAAVLAGCAPIGTPSVMPSAYPTATLTAPVPSPSAPPIALRPYQLKVLDSRGSSISSKSIAATSDCDFLSTDWLRSFCGLTLRADWRTIIGPTDPFVEPADGTDSVTWMAALARAQIEGDTSLCLDVAARFWMSAGSVNKSAPEPGSTDAPIRPVAACIADFRNVAAKGSFNGPADGPNVIELAVDPGALARIDGGPTASLDPIVGCSEPMNHDACNAIFDAVAAALGTRQGQVRSLVAQAEPISCLTVSTPCPPPSVGTWVGGARVDLASSGLYFDVVDIRGQVTASEVPKP